MLPHIMSLDEGYESVRTYFINLQTALNAKAGELNNTNIFAKSNVVMVLLAKPLIDVKPTVQLKISDLGSEAYFTVLCGVF
jgi:hypothetical protein